MCGITGIFDLGKNKKISKKVLLNMTNSMVHRGPDDSGVVVLKNVGLGNRRLAIIDLSKKGHMPMSDEKNEVWIVYNGEIYNFKEIRKELLDKNYKFKSESDTEVIIYAYKEWGIDCIKKFSGMFAFSLFDIKKNELFLVRDRLGIKPLYYAKINSAFVFASEIKAILKYPNFKREVNLKAISSYLSYRYELGEETLFKNIYKLMPGHYLSIKNNKIKIVEYWDIDIGKRITPKPEKYYKNEIRKLLEKSVQRRMISDVPVGAYLSGGLDSSIIVALMAKSSNKKVKTFSIGFKEQGFDEFYYSKQVAKMYNTDHKEIVLSMKDYLKSMKKLIHYKDLPLSVPNEVPIYLMSKELKKYITVVLSGEGADEIFSGYGRLFRSPLDYKKLKYIEYLPLFLRKILFKQFIVKYKNKHFNSELEHFLFNYSYFPLEEKKLIFNKKMNEIIDDDKNLISIFYDYFKKAGKKSYYEKIWYVFEKIHLPGLLQRLDCPTMATSVEGRVPYVDHTLVEFMFTVPTKYKMKWKSFPAIIKSLNQTSDEISESNDTTKYILRETFKDILPKEVIERKKKGFPVPLDVWFRRDINKIAEKELLNINSKIHMIINQKNLKKWIDYNLKSGKDKSFGQKLWMLLNLEYWLREYFSD